MDIPDGQVWTAPVDGYGHTRWTGMDSPVHRVGGYSFSILLFNVLYQCNREGIHVAPYLFSKLSGFCSGLRLNRQGIVADIHHGAYEL